MGKGEPPAFGSRAAALGQQSARYAVGQFAAVGIGVPLQLYVAKVLGPSSLGQYSMLDALVMVMTTCLGFGLGQGVLKWLPTYMTQGRYNSLRAMIGGGFRFLFLIGISAYALLIFAYSLAQDSLLWLLPSWSVVLVGGALIPLGLLHGFVQQALRGFQDIRQLIFGTVYLQLGFKLVMTVALLRLGLGLQGYLYAVTISTAAACLWMWSVLHKHIRELPNSSETPVEGWSSYSQVLYGSTLIGLGSGYLDRFLSGLLLGPVSVGILSVAKQLQNLPAVSLQLVLNLVTPWFSSSHGDNDLEECKRIYHFSVFWMVRLGLPLSVFLMLFAEPVLRVFGEEFVEQGVPVLRFLVAGQIVNLLTGPVGSVLNMCGHEKSLLRIIGFEQVLVIAGLILVTPLWGLNAVAGVVSLGLVVKNLTACFVIYRKLGISWYDPAYRRLIFPVLCLVVGGLVLRSTLPDKLAVVTLLGLAVVSYLVWAGIEALNGFSAEDKLVVGSFLATMKRL